MKDGWTKKIKGTAIIYTHPNTCDGRAIVVNSYGIFFNGNEYESLAEAKASAVSVTSPDREAK